MTDTDFSRDFYKISRLLWAFAVYGNDKSMPYMI